MQILRLFPSALGLFDHNFGSTDDVESASHGLDVIQRAILLHQLSVGGVDVTAMAEYVGDILNGIGSLLECDHQVIVCSVEVFNPVLRRYDVTSVGADVTCAISVLFTAGLFEVISFLCKVATGYHYVDVWIHPCISICTVNTAYRVRFCSKLSSCEGESLKLLLYLLVKCGSVAIQIEYRLTSLGFLYCIECKADFVIADRCTLILEELAF